MNWQTMVVMALILGILAAIIVRGIWKRKNGKATCSCGCTDCALKGSCHKK